MKTRLPLHPLSNENAYGDPKLLHDLARPGAAFARRLGVDVIVGAETGGIPLATAVALAGEFPFAVVRKPGYVGHEDHEPRVRGAAVAGRRVLLVDDAVSSGTALEAFADELQGEGAILVGAFTLVDMRDVASSVMPIATTVPIESIATYLEVLAAATDQGVLDPGDPSTGRRCPRQSVVGRRPPLVAPGPRRLTHGMRQSARIDDFVTSSPVPLVKQS